MRSMSTTRNRRHRSCYWHFQLPMRASVLYRPKPRQRGRHCVQSLIWLHPASVVPRPVFTITRQPRLCLGQVVPVLHSTRQPRYPWPGSPRLAPLPGSPNSLYGLANVGIGMSPVLSPRHAEPLAAGPALPGSPPRAPTAHARLTGAPARPTTGGDCLDQLSPARGVAQLPI